MRAIVQAALDPSSETRNNVIRALGVLLAARADLKNKVSSSPFIDLIRSGDWTDRNKGISVLLELTSDRDPQLLANLKGKALRPLIEMARWKFKGHSYSSQVILGRIAGIEEKQISQLIAAGKLEEIIQASKK